MEARAALASLLLLCACGAGGATTAERLMAFCARYEHELCAWYDGCASSRALGGACEDVLDLGPSCKRALSRIEEGRLAFDGDAAMACLDAAHAANESCAPGPWEGCDRFLHGTIPAGAACIEPGDCAPGAVCQVGTTCPGTCVKLPGEGEPCDWAVGCAEGLGCSPGGECVVEGTNCGGGPVCGAFDPCQFEGCGGLPKLGDVCDPRTTPFCAPELRSPLGGWREVTCDPSRKVCMPVVHGGACGLGWNCGIYGWCDGTCVVSDCIGAP